MVRKPWITYGSAALFALVAVVLVVMFIKINNNANSVRQLAQANHTLVINTHKTLCTFTNDLEKRIQNTEEFLDEHPNGIPGIPKSAFVVGLNNQKETLEALSDLKCKDKK